MMKNRFLMTQWLVLGAASFGISGLGADGDWPRLFGPTGMAAVEKADVPLTWSDSENLLWKVDLPGPGSSSPIVLGDKVFVTCWSGYGDKPEATDMTKLVRHLVCVSLGDGKILWDAEVPSTVEEDPYQGFITEHGYATHTPVTDGQNVYVFFGKSGAVAFDLEGKKLWQTNLGQMSGRTRWGSAGSPVVWKDLVIYNATDEARAIIALDKASGSVRWKADGDVLTMAYGTPMILPGADGKEDLVMAVPGELWGLNPETGKLRWYALHGLTGNVSPSVVVGEGKAFVFGGYPATGAVGMKLGGKGDVTDANHLWQSKSSTYVPTPILYNGHLYVVNDQGFAICLKADSGEEVYRERVMEGSGGASKSGAGGKGRGGSGKPFYASPLRVGNVLFCPSRRNGVFVIEASPTFKKLGVNTFSSDSSQFNGSPAVVGNTILLRSEKALYRVGKR